MDPIIELADKLGRSIAESPQAARLREARQELDKHQDVKKLLQDYQAQSEKIDKLEEANKPVEVADKHSLQELHDQLVSSDVFKKFTAAQVDYVDLMRKVNDALRKQLGQTER